MRDISITLSRVILNIAIAALVISALVGLLQYFFSGHYDRHYYWIGNDLIRIGVATGVFGFIAYPCSRLFEKGRYRFIALSGMIASGLSILLWVLLIFRVIDFFGSTWHSLSAGAQIMFALFIVSAVLGVVCALINRFQRD